MDEEAERAGDLMTAIMGEVRKQKNKLGVPLNKPVKRLAIYADEKALADARLGDRDMKETLKIEEIDLRPPAPARLRSRDTRA